MTENKYGQRQVRSFVRRTGRMTSGQQRALDSLWPTYGLDYQPQAINGQTLFGRSAPLVFEIGFGNGETLVELATRSPDKDFIGVEVHEPGVGHCMMHAEAAALTNLRLVCHDAMDVLEQQIADASLSRINLYFPDPWPKKRHHKRRIVQPPFLALCRRKLAADGHLHIATDWANYAEHIDEVVAESDVFRIAERRQHAGDNALERPNTKFERRGLRKGHEIFDWKLAAI